MRRRRRRVGCAVCAGRDRGGFVNGNERASRSQQQSGSSSSEDNETIFPGGCSHTSGKNPPAHAGRLKSPGFDPWVGKIPWRGQWQPTPYSCLENPMAGGAWRATSMGSPRVGHDGSGFAPPRGRGNASSSRKVCRSLKEMEKQLRTP